MPMAMPDTLLFKLKDLKDDETLKKVYVVVSKTSSAFNKNLEELPKIKTVVEHYLKKYPYLGEYPIRILPSFPNAYFNFESKEFALGLFNSSILAHELEHAISLKDSQKYSKLLAISKLVNNLSSRFGIPVFLGTALKHGHPEHSDKVNLGYDILSATHGLSSLPSLYEEGKADVSAIWNSPEKIDTMKTLLPSYGSYLYNTALPISFYQLAKQVQLK
jgi:hypothetical protein